MMQTNPVPNEAELDALVRDTSDFLEADIEVPEVITLQLLAAITALRKPSAERLSLARALDSMACGLYPAALTDTEALVLRQAAAELRGPQAEAEKK